MSKVRLFNPVQEMTSQKRNLALVVLLAETLQSTPLSVRGQLDQKWSMASLNRAFVFVVSLLDNLFAYSNKLPSRAHWYEAAGNHVSGNHGNFKAQPSISFPASETKFSAHGDLVYKKEAQRIHEKMKSKRKCPCQNVILNGISIRTWLDPKQCLSAPENSITNSNSCKSLRIPRNPGPSRSWHQHESRQDRIGESVSVEFGRWRERSRDDWFPEYVVGFPREG